MARWLATLTALSLFFGSALPELAAAADQSVPHRALHARYHYVRYARDCGCCGCWYPDYVWHRPILYRYPSDPRYTLTSEPRYVRGPVRRYLHNLF